MLTFGAAAARALNAKPLTDVRQNLRTELAALYRKCERYADPMDIPARDLQRIAQIKRALQIAR